MVKVRKNLSGQKFGKLTVIEQTEDYTSPKGRREDRWRCICDKCKKVISLDSRRDDYEEKVKQINVNNTETEKIIFVIRKVK